MPNALSPLYLRESGPAWVPVSVQGCYPFPCREAKPVERNSALVSRQVVQAAQAGFEQGARAAPIAALIMMKRRGNLNDSLQKPLLRPGGSQPNLPET